MKIKALIFTVIMFISVLHANNVSNLQGDLSVNNGTLHYAVPLQVPVGTAGVQPKISLNYNSNGRNGYFGVGWQLTGLSTISRCGSNFAFDDEQQGVKYDNSDNICLNGQRLVLVSGKQWEANSEYRTKIETYSKILYDGENFKIWKKSGDIEEYTLINQNWFLTQRSDRFSNSIEYTYFSSSAEVYLTEITYADNKITFNYEDRNDTYSGYSRGFNIRLSKRVKSIEIKSANDVLRTYKLMYKNQLTSLDKSKLISITECSQGECLQPLMFEYSQAEFGYTETMNLDFLTARREDITYADFNGDGLLDINEYDKPASQTNVLWINNGDKSFTKTTYQLSQHNNGVKFADLNSDGLMDIFEITESSYYVWENKGNATFVKLTPILSIGSNIKKEQIELVDINGDGLIDIYENKNQTVWLNKQNFYFQETPNNMVASDDLNRTAFQDFNGDGLIDVYNDVNKTLYFNEGQASFVPVAYDFGRVELGDFNGDGYVDLYTLKNLQYKIFINKGDRTFYEITNHLLTALDNYILHDFNGDGITDSFEIHDKYSWVLLAKWELTNTGDEEINYDSKFGSTSMLVNKADVQLYDFTGDGISDIYEVSTKKVYISSLKKSTLISITDSFLNKTTITYKPLTDKSTYKKHTDGIYPNIDVSGPIEVVSSVTVPTPNGQTMTKNYLYEGLKSNLQGLGSLGFAKISTTNESSGIRSETTYEQNFPFTGYIKEVNVYMGATLISKTNHHYSFVEDHNRYRVHNDEQSTKTFDFSGPLKTSTINYSDFDEYGNIGTAISKIVDETTSKTFTTTTHNSFTNNSSKWILGRLNRATVTHEAYGDTKTKTSSFTYDDNTGILTSETIEPDNAKWLTKSYTYDSAGNKLSETITGTDIQEGITTYNYDPLGKFATSVTNALGHTATRQYNADGQLVQATDPNGFSTAWTYDAFGKQTSETRADGTKSLFTYAFSTDAPQSYYSIMVRTDGAPLTITYYNRLNNIVCTKKDGFNGLLSSEEVTYDQFGNVVKKSLPHFSNETPEYIYMTYDEFQRTLTVDSPAPNGSRSVESAAYSGFSVTSTNAKGQVKTTTKNAMDKVVHVQEEEGASQEYQYDALGNLVSTIDSQGNTITLAYDIFGNKTDQNDPDMGIWSYDYNALGQLVAQTDAKGQTTSFTYDLLGRKTDENINGVISTWEYDTTYKGLLHKESKPDFNRVYSYDSYGRINQVQTEMGAQTYVKSYNYDQYGRLETKILPNNFQVINVYNAHGYLEAIKSPKEQIADFDTQHFLNLIDQTLVDAIEYYKLSLEYEAKERELREQAMDYRRLASHSWSSRDELYEIAYNLEALARQYRYYAEEYQNYAEEHRRRADDFLRTAQAITWGNSTGESSYYESIAQSYQTYSQQYAYWTRQHINSSSSIDMYEEDVEYYIALAEAAITESNEALQITEQYAQKAGHGLITNEAYIAIQADSAYNYFYKVLEQDASNRVTSYLSGNGLVTTKKYNASGVLNTISTGYDFDDNIRALSFEYDELANVTVREDKRLNVRQTYAYDDLNRITNAETTTQTGLSSMSYRYDLLGNMTYKSDIGDYAYASASPYQVTSAGSKTFTYDANGNMETNDGTSIEYTAFNKPSAFTTGGDTVNFYYDTNKNRYKKQTSQYTVYYLDKDYEKTYLPNTQQEDKYFIYVGSKVMAIYTNSTSSLSTKYLHYDSLGSVDTITNNVGVVEQRMAYKPFGEKLNLDKDGNAVETAAFTNRGYTGHEHVQETGFIHMNGRVYDPTIGRFLSADPYIQAPYYTQSFNRYSYVMNNPLKYIDPSGFEATDLGIIYVYAEPVQYEFYTTYDYYGSGDMDDYTYQMDYPSQSELDKIATERYEAEARGSRFDHQSAAAVSISNGTNSFAQQRSSYFDSAISWGSSLDYHDALTALSVVPFVGGVAGAVDAFSYLYNGEYATAASMFAVGFIPGGKLGMKVVGKLGKYSVGPYNKLKGQVTGLDAHHVGQRTVMKKLISNYNANTAPSILVPKLGHTRGSGVLSRRTTGFTNARQVLARDIQELRRVYPDIPNGTLQELIQMNKNQYPGAFIKL